MRVFRGRSRSPTYPADYPSWLVRDVVLLDGRSVNVRPVLPSDAAELRRAVEQADPQTLRLRFLGARPPTTEEEFRRLVEVDYQRRLALVAHAPDGVGAAIARYEALGTDPVAEVAVAVDPRWRHVGLATALMRLLAEAAITNGIEHFTAAFFSDNLDVSDLLSESGMPYRSSGQSTDVVDVEVTLPATSRGIL